MGGMTFNKLRLGEQQAGGARTPRRKSESESRTPRRRLSEAEGRPDLVKPKTPVRANLRTSKRRTILGYGMSFGQYTLVQGSKTVDYSARAAPGGCGILRVSKDNYVRLLRRREEKQMSEAVKMLKASPFFSMWTQASLERERRHIEPNVHHEPRYGVGHRPSVERAQVCISCSNGDACSRA